MTLANTELEASGLDRSRAVARIQMRGVDIHGRTLGRADAHAQVALARPAIEVRTQPTVADPIRFASDLAGQRQRRFDEGRQPGAVGSREGTEEDRHGRKKNLRRHAPQIERHPVATGADTSLHLPPDHSVIFEVFLEHDDVVGACQRADHGRSTAWVVPGNHRRQTMNVVREHREYALWSRLPA